MTERVLVFGTYDEGVHPRTRVLRQGLVDRGLDVVVNNAPLGVSTAERVALLGSPAGLPRLLLALLGSWWRLVRGRIRGGRCDAVLVGYLGHLDVVLARVLHPRTTIVLDYLVSLADTAVDRRAEGGGLLRVLRWLDRVACACADVVLVDTTESVATVPTRARGKVVVVPVGAPHDWFHEPPVRRPAGPLRVVFFGLFTPLQGAPVVLDGLRRAVEQGLEVEATIIGDGQDRATAEALAPRSGVTWHDWVEPSALPALVASHDVCLGILGDTPKARRVVPNKAYQGAAAGTLVVTSDTPSQRRALPSQTVFVPPADAAALARALLSLPPADELLATRRASRDEAVAAFSPASVVAPLVAALTG